MVGSVWRVDAMEAIMIRYWGQPYEGSDDEANDMIRSAQERAGQIGKSPKPEKAKKKTKASGKK